MYFDPKVFSNLSVMGLWGCYPIEVGGRCVALYKSHLKYSCNYGNVYCFSGLGREKITNWSDQKI